MTCTSIRPSSIPNPNPNTNPNHLPPAPPVPPHPQAQKLVSSLERRGEALLPRAGSAQRELVRDGGDQRQHLQHQQQHGSTPGSDPRDWARESAHAWSPFPSPSSFSSAAGAASTPTRKPSPKTRSSPMKAASSTSPSLLSRSGGKPVPRPGKAPVLTVYPNQRLDPAKVYRRGFENFTDMTNSARRPTLARFNKTSEGGFLTWGNNAQDP